MASCGYLAMAIQSSGGPMVLDGDQYFRSVWMALLCRPPACGD